MIRASHLPDQPLEVPEREVEHDLPADEYVYGVEHILGFGHVRDEDFWGWPSKREEDAWWKERRRKDEARAQLGGFGFGAHVARAGQGDG